MPVRFYRDDKRNIFHSSNGVKVASIGFRPCGYCMDCRLSRATDKAIRMVHESRFHSQSSFLTLTYSDDRLPPSGSLCYDHVSDFLKRLRRRLDKESTKVSFYRVGEYGENFSRPHYHMILFGYDFSEPIKYKGIINSRVKSGSKDDRIYYKSSFLTDCWSHGFADIGDVDFSTCQYVSKYVTKKLFGRNAYGSLESERASSSNANPIGKRWIEQYYRDVYPHDYVVFDGKKFPPPRYYDDWLSREVPELFSIVKQSREDNLSRIDIDLRDLHAKHVIRRQSQSKFLRDGCAPNLSLDDRLILDKSELLFDISEGKL